MLLDLKIAGVAQQAEQLICNQQVVGSIPITSSNSMGGFPSGQREQTVNLLSVTSMVRIHLLPPKKDCNFDTELQSFLTKSAFVGINPLRG